MFRSVANSQQVFDLNHNGMYRTAARVAAYKRIAKIVGQDAEPAQCQYQLKNAHKHCKRARYSYSIFGQIVRVYGGGNCGVVYKNISVHLNFFVYRIGG